MFRVKDSDIPTGLSATAAAVLAGQSFAMLIGFGLLSLVLWEYLVPAREAGIPGAGGLRGAIRLRLALAVLLAAALVLGSVAMARLWGLYLASRRSLHRVKLLAHDVLASLDQGVITTDEQDTITSINSGAIAMLGVDFECVGKPLACVSTADAPLAELSRRVAERREPVRDREFACARDGRARQLLADALDLKDTRGRAFGRVIHLRDVTERVRMKEQMWRLEQMANLNTLAAGLHHEIKNPLTALSIHVQLLEERLRGPSADGPAREALGVLRDEVRRLNGVLERFRDFASLQRLDERPTDAAALIGSLAGLIRPQAEQQGVRLAVRLPEGGLPPAPLDAAKLEQALLNLVINALEAMPDGGELAVAAEAVGGELRVEVGDTGPGIPPEHREHLFAPYFSTKERGSGLGLALAAKLVRQHGGRIDFRTGPGGTTFRIAVPLAGRDGGDEPSHD